MADITFSQQLGTFATRVGTECKALHTIAGKLAELTTTDKASLVAAINEVKSSAGSISSALNSLTTRVSTAEKNISNNTGDIATVQSAVQTLNSSVSEIESALSEIDALEKLAAGHVKYDAAQSLTTAQQTQARTNIGAASASDMTSIQSCMTAVETKATTNATNHTTLSTNIGDTGTDFVALFEAALTSA